MGASRVVGDVVSGGITCCRRCGMGASRVVRDVVWGHHTCVFLSWTFRVTSTCSTCCKPSPTILPSSSLRCPRARQTGLWRM